MFSERLDLKGSGPRLSLASGLMDHPVFMVMSSVVRSLMSAEARRLTLKPGEEAPEDHLIFVMKGILVLHEIGTGLAAGVMGPGTFLGGPGVSTDEAATRARAISDSVIYAVPISVLSQLGRSMWIDRFLKAHATSRARMMGSERTCMACHPHVERLAKWCLRLHQAQISVHDPLTPTVWARLIGVTEADLMTAWRLLNRAGAVEDMPGAVKGFDPERLGRLACGCDHEIHDGGVERRSRRRLLRRH